jgi:hypothetical protein
LMPQLLGITGPWHCLLNGICLALTAPTLDDRTENVLCQYWCVEAALQGRITTTFTVFMVTQASPGQVILQLGHICLNPPGLPQQVSMLILHLETATVD